MLALLVIVLQGVTAARLEVDGPRVLLEIELPAERPEALGAYLRSRVTLDVDGRRLPPASLTLGAPARIEWRAAQDVRRLRLRAALFLESDPEHRTRIELPGVGAVDLHRHSPTLEWASPAPTLPFRWVGLSVLATAVALAAAALWRVSSRDPLAESARRASRT